MLAFGVSQIIVGILMFFYALVGFSSSSKFAAKVKVDELTIELKNSFWKASTILNWSDISSIQLQSFNVIFNLKDSSTSFSYTSNAETSVDIKRTLGECAEQKNIEVTGG
jgi:hypothetical protein